MTRVKSISPAELEVLLREKAGLRLVDVRSPSEYKEKHIPSAENIPVDQIEAGAFSAKEGELIVTTCGSGGGRSERSARLIAESTQREVYFLEGGTFGWFKERGT